MQYNINKNEINQCRLCAKTIKELKKVYGGGGVYLIDVFKQHILLDHKITLEEYFSQFLERPVCKCGICQQQCNIKCSRNVLKWSEFTCGRYPGLMKWAEDAKTSRKGVGNPMYQKQSWNTGLSKEDHPSLMSNSIKNQNKIVSNETRLRQSKSALKRTIHGHTGIKHSIESKEKMRTATLNRIRNGDFKQTKTKPHLEFKKILDSLNITYEEEKIVDCWSFDFYIPSHKLYIEVDGDYFHSNPILYPNGPKTKTQKINAYRDKQKNEYCKHNNFILLRFWECDILNESELILCELKKLLT